MYDAAAAEFLSIPDLLKATPAEEGGKRFVYVEASKETRDSQGETVLADALAESAPYFLRYGNLDKDHITQIGPVKGIPGYAMFEIGRPVDVQAQPGRVFVKGEVFQGDTPVADQANHFWDSLTKVRPAQRWYPSVGGAVRARETRMDPATRTPHTFIKAVRWTNIGFSKTPVNLDVPTATTVPFGVFAKSWTAAGFDLTDAMGKALAAGYGTDDATLTGGGALRTESLDHKPQSYWDFKDRLAGDIRARRVQPTASDMVGHAAAHYGLGRADAAEWTERFLADLKDGLQHTKRKTP